MYLCVRVCICIFLVYEFRQRVSRLRARSLCMCFQGASHPVLQVAFHHLLHAVQQPWSPASSLWNLVEGFSPACPLAFLPASIGLDLSSAVRLSAHCLTVWPGCLQCLMLGPAALAAKYIIVLTPQSARHLVPRLATLRSAWKLVQLVRTLRPTPPRRF